MTYIIVGIIIIVTLVIYACLCCAGKADQALRDLDCTDLSDMTYREEPKR